MCWCTKPGKMGHSKNESETGETLASQEKINNKMLRKKLVLA